METVRVKCRQCGKQVRPDELVLDHVLKKMVCHYCVADREQREQVHKEVNAQKVVVKAKDGKPAGWDREDEMIEKAWRQKKDGMVTVKWLSEDKCKYVCPKCCYEFTINTEKNIPAHCPYCGADIAKFQ